MFPVETHSFVTPVSTDWEEPSLLQCTQSAGLHSRSDHVHRERKRKGGRGIRKGITSYAPRLSTVIYHLINTLLSKWRLTNQYKDQREGRRQYDFINILMSQFFKINTRRGTTKFHDILSDPEVPSLKIAKSIYVIEIVFTYCSPVYTFNYSKWQFCI